MRDLSIRLVEYKLHYWIPVYRDDRIAVLISFHIDVAAFGFSVHDPFDKSHVRPLPAIPSLPYGRAFPSSASSALPA